MAGDAAAGPVADVQKEQCFLGLLSHFAGNSARIGCELVSTVLTVR
jgi:hypothetical protein